MEDLSTEWFDWVEKDLKAHYSQVAGVKRSLGSDGSLIIKLDQEQAKKVALYSKLMPAD